MAFLEAVSKRRTKMSGTFGAGYFTKKALTRVSRHWYSILTMITRGTCDKKDKKRIPALLIIWIAWIGFFLFLILPHLNRPVLGWELFNWETAKEIALQGPAVVQYFLSPALYPSLLAFFFTIGGVSEAVVRITGILCIIIMPIAIYHLIKEISCKEDFFHAVLIAGALFLTSPAVIQGSLTIDQADSTLLAPLFCLFYITLFKTERYSFRHRSLLLAIIFALCLWTKITTPLACVVAIPLAFFSQKEIKKGVVFSLGVFITGGVIFLTGWFLYCQLIAGSHKFFDPFTFYTHAAKDTVFSFSRGTVSKIITDIFRVTLWFSPLFLLLAGVVIPRVWKKDDHGESPRKALFLAIFAAVVFITYGYANTTCSGFPKYLLPALPMVCCLMALGLGKSLKSYGNGKIYILGLVSICIGVVYYYLCVGDGVYTIYLFRQAQLIGGIKEVFFHLLRQQALSFLFPAALFIVSMYLLKIKLFDRVILVLFIALIANNIALGLIQRQAGYALNYAYGTEGSEELRHFLKTGGIRDVYTSIDGYMANVDSITFHNPGNGTWRTPADFLAFLEQEKPSCVIYGLAVNSAVDLARVMRDKNVILRLHADYREIIFGSYHVLLKNYGCPPARTPAGYLNYGCGGQS